MNTCRMNGSVVRASEPIASLFTGTSRQPRSLAPSSLITREKRSHTVPGVGIGRQEQHPTPYSPAPGNLIRSPLHALKKLVRHLKQNTDAVSGTRITALRPPMSQVFQDLKPLLHDRMRFLALDVDDKPDPARVFLMLRIV